MLTDAHGNLICGEDFDIGKTCTLPPDHGPIHATICQNCGEDWWDGECTC